MGFRGDNRAEPGNSRSGRKAGLLARENLLGGGGARHSVQFPQPLLAGTLAHSVGLTHGPAPTPQDCRSLHKYFFSPLGAWLESVDVAVFVLMSVSVPLVVLCL